MSDQDGDEEYVFSHEAEQLNHLRAKRANYTEHQNPSQEPQCDLTPESSRAHTLNHPARREGQNYEHAQKRVILNDQLSSGAMFSSYQDRPASTSSPNEDSHGKRPSYDFQQPRNPRQAFTQDYPVQRGHLENNKYAQMQVLLEDHPNGAAWVASSTHRSPYIPTPDPVGATFPQGKPISALLRKLEPAKLVMPDHISYHGKLTGKEAEGKLAQCGERTCYLTRYSENQKKYILSVLHDYEGEQSVIHTELIIDTEEQSYTLEGIGKIFGQLSELLSYYEGNPLSADIRRIGTPCLSQHKQQQQPQQRQQPQQQPKQQPQPNPMALMQQMLKNQEKMQHAQEKTQQALFDQLKEQRELFQQQLNEHKKTIEDQKQVIEQRRAEPQEVKPQEEEVRPNVEEAGSEREVERGLEQVRNQPEQVQAQDKKPCAIL